MKKWLQRNKVYFETTAAISLALMALIVSIKQCSISNQQTSLLDKQTNIANRQTNLLKDQTDLLKIQTNVSELEYKKSIVHDSIQFKIDSMQLTTAEKQTHILELQTSFNYIPQLKIEYAYAPTSYSVDSIILRNIGYNKIYNINVLPNFGVYFHDTKFFVPDSFTWGLKNIIKEVDLLMPGASVSFPIEKAFIKKMIWILQVGRLDQVDKNSYDFISYYKIKYRNPDMKIYQSYKYLAINFDDPNNWLTDIEDGPFMWQDIDIKRAIIKYEQEFQ